MIKFRDLQKQYDALKPDIDDAVQSVLNDSNFILGEPVFRLEKELADYVGREHCISCGNGTDALFLALRAFDIGAGDAVFVTDFSYIASASAICRVGATPVFVDIDKKTFNIDPLSLEKQIRKVRTEKPELLPRAVIAVDLFGLPADYDALNAVARKYDLVLVEDAAQAFGGEYKGQKACSFGDIAITSFFPAKPLGCYGDGGAVFTDSDEVKERLISLRSNGRSKKSKYENIEIGINSRLDTIQAAILLRKLKAFSDYELDSVNQIAKLYNSKLGKSVVSPFVPDNCLSSWAQYSILLKNSEARKEVIDNLSGKNIPAMVYYPQGLHQQKVFEYLNSDDKDYPNTIDVCGRVLSLPMHPYLTENDIDEIVGCIK